MSENTMTKSQAKRKARQEENKKAKREATRAKIITNLIIALVFLLFLAGIGSFVYYKTAITQASNDYGAYLNEDGTIKGVDPADHIVPLDYHSIPVSQADIAYTDEDMENALNSVLTSHREASLDASLTAADGDTLNIDYVGIIDGVEFEGGSTNGNGADLTLGSGSYIDDFEDQLVGSHPGDHVTVNVTFPEDYTNEEVQGKDAVFEVTVNSIYVLPELTDALIVKYYGDVASSVEEYKDYLKTTNEASKLQSYLVNYIQENASASSVDEGHLKYLKSIGKQEQETYYTSFNQSMMMYTGSPAYSSFSEYTGMSNSEFEAYLDEECRKRAAVDMTYQYIFSDAGLTLEDADYETKVSSLGSNAFDTYGRKYIMQMTLQDKVISYLMEQVTIQ